MTLRTAVATVERYDRAVAGMEDAAVQRLNRALDGAAVQLESQLRQSYDAIASNATLLQAQRRLLVLQELGSLLQIVRPELAGSYQAMFADVITLSTQTGATLGDELIKALAPGSVLPAFSNPPIEAVAIAARDTYNRLSRYGQQFADNATNIISEGLLQGWGVGRLTPLIRNQLGVTKGRAEMIVRTEAISNLSSAAQARYTDAGVDGVIWLPVKNRVCKYCAGRAGKVFKLSEIRHPPHPQCRCTLVPYKREWALDEDFLQEYRDKVIANSDATDNGLAPFEKSAGFKTAPTPLWTPGQPKDEGRPARRQTSGSVDALPPPQATFAWQAGKPQDTDWATLDTDAAARDAYSKVRKRDRNIYSDYSDRIAEAKTLQPANGAKIPPEELAALRWYTESGYKDINKALRGQTNYQNILNERVSTVTARYVDDAKFATAALNKMPVYQGTVYRGAKFAPDEVQAIANRYKVGETIIEQGFTSTAAGAPANFWNSANIRYIINSRDGRDVQSVSGVRVEKEVLFRPYTKYQVLDKTTENGVTTIYLDEVKK